jgi:type I site-specific restriction endonuclease
MKLNGIITKRGLEIIKSKIIEKYNEKGYKKLLKKFIIKYKSPIGTFFIEKKNYKIIGDTIILPRFGASDLLHFKVIESIDNLISEGKQIDITYTGTPTYNQQIIIDYIFKNIYNEENKNKGLCGLTLNALAGSGKTFTAMNIINRLKNKTLIVVPNTYLLTQWVELLEEFFPNNKIGQYYGKIKKDGDIVVAIINSLINEEFTFIYTQLIEVESIKKGKKKIKKEKTIIVKTYEEYFKEFGFVILDESHIYCTDSFKVVYNRFQSTYMLGLSATPNERTNNCDIISHLNIGKVLIANEIENYKNDNTQFSAVVSIVKYNGPDKYTNIHINETTKMICVPKIIEEIVNDEYRNKLIINQIYELFNLKLNIFVFSERRSHLEHLYEQFNDLLDSKFEENETKYIKNNLAIPELDINKNIVLYGNSSSDDINNAKINSNVIFTTYAYSSTGVSINRMTAMVLTTPRRSKSVQIIGRIFRLNNENNHIQRIIVDIVDNKSVLKNQLYERMKAYKERLCIIKKKEINYSDINLKNIH